jgi:predicted Holliday junction resolvase-like endonuclease
MNTLNLIFGLCLVIFILIIILIHFIKKTNKLEEKISDLKSSKKSVEVKYGQTWEEFVPFLEDFPYTKENFKFIGNPIDGIAFEDNKIAFVEIKTGHSKMSEKQKHIKDLIEQGKIEFKELRY